jgi:ferritin
MNESLKQALQEQLTRERQNEANYRAKAAQAEAANYPGVSAWMKRAADDERLHASLIEGYLIDRNEIPVYANLMMVDTLPGEALVDLFADALALEQGTTAALETLYYLAAEAEDPRTCSFLIVPRGDFPGFMEEQTQSEREITDILMDLRRLDKTGWKLLDNAFLK